MVKRVAFLIFIILLLGSRLEIRAADDVLQEEYEGMLDSVPDGIEDMLPNEIDGVGDAAQELISWDNILDMLFDAIGLNMRSVLRSFASLCSVIALCSLLNMMNKSVRNVGAARALELVGGVAVASAAIEISEAPIRAAMELFDRIRLFVNSASPLICSLYAVGGNASSALVHNYGMIVFLSLTENIFILSIELTVGACMALALASSFVSHGGLLPLSSSIKKAFTFFVGLVMVVFTAVISAQSTLASKSDTISSKTAKMLASQMIPLVGSTIGDSLRTAGASVEYLRSSVGVIMIVILAMTVLPTLISILMYRAVFSLGNAVASLLDCDREGRMLSEISGILGYILAILSAVSLMLLLLITIFAKSVSPLS